MCKGSLLSTVLPILAIFHGFANSYSNSNSWFLVIVVCLFAYSLACLYETLESGCSPEGVSASTLPLSCNLLELSDFSFEVGSD